MKGIKLFTAWLLMLIVIFAVLTPKQVAWAADQTGYMDKTTQTPSIEKESLSIEDVSTSIVLTKENL